MLGILGGSLRKTAATSSARGGVQLLGSNAELFAPSTSASIFGGGAAAWIRAESTLEQATEPAKEGAETASLGGAPDETSATSSEELPRVRPQDLMAFFTCSKCGTRAAKGFSKKAYEEGVVIVNCPGCQVKHLMADHLGWFGEDTNVEEILAEKGQDVVRRRADGTMEVRPEHIAGWSKGPEMAPKDEGKEGKSSLLEQA